MSSVQETLQTDEKKYKDTRSVNSVGLLLVPRSLGYLWSRRLGSLIRYCDLEAVPLIPAGLVVLSNNLKSIQYSRQSKSSSGAVDKIPDAPEFSRTEFVLRTTIWLLRSPPPPFLNASALGDLIAPHSKI